MAYGLIWRNQKQEVNRITYDTKKLAVAAAEEMAESRGTGMPDLVYDKDGNITWTFGPLVMTIEEIKA